MMKLVSDSPVLDRQSRRLHIWWLAASEEGHKLSTSTIVMEGASRSVGFAIKGITVWNIQDWKASGG